MYQDNKLQTSVLCTLLTVAQVGKSYTKAMGGGLVTSDARLKGFCQSKNNRFGLCSSVQFLNMICHMSSLHIIKTVRLGLDVAQRRFLDPETKDGLKMIYIARDPRGLYNSRFNLKWCKRTKRCISPKMICEDLEKDYWTAKALAISQRNNFM